MQVQAHPIKDIEEKGRILQGESFCKNVSPYLNAAVLFHNSIRFEMERKVLNILWLSFCCLQ